MDNVCGSNALYMEDYVVRDFEKSISRDANIYHSNIISIDKIIERNKRKELISDIFTYVAMFASVSVIMAEIFKWLLCI